MKVMAIIQARMDSTRLPGKVLMELCGHPVLYHIIERVKQVKCINQILVATSTNAEDNVIYDFCQAIGVDCFRGDNSNVLHRYFDAAASGHAEPDDIIIRLTADNPLVDPIVLDGLLAYFEQCDAPYASTSGFPLGVGAEVFTYSTLTETFEQATKAYEKEHVTPYMYREGRIIGQFIAPTDYSRFRFTMDTPEDYEFIKQIYRSLYHGSHNFYLNDVLDLLKEHPCIAEINAHVQQKGVEE